MKNTEVSIGGSGISFGAALAAVTKRGGE